MSQEQFNNCMQRIDKDDPLMVWAMHNLNILDICIKRSNDINFLKNVCNNVLKSLELADLDSSVLVDFLDHRGFGVKLETNKNHQMH